MRKSLGLLMILVSVIAFAFVSCDASTVPVSDKLGAIVVADSQSRTMNVAVENISNVESLYWYYKAEKQDGGLFNTGATDGFVPVKKTQEGAPDKGLSGANLGSFSYGSWKFTLCGVKTVISGNTIEDASIIYTGNQTINVDKDKNFLNLTLTKGEGLTTEIVFGTVSFEHTNIKSVHSFTISVVDTVLGQVVSTIDTTKASVLVENGRVSFTGLKYNATGNIADGKHVMIFTLTQNNVNENIATVATYELPYIVQKGYKYTIQGNLTSAEVQGEVEMGSYVVDVPATTASLVLPVTVNATDSSKSVKDETTVSTLDLSVKYPVGVVLTDNTNTAGSGNNITADATIGFKLNPEVEGGITIDAVGATQELTKYELILNVDQTNRTLVEVSKFIGKDLEIEAVYHNSVSVQKNGSDGLSAGDEYYDYTPSEGILKLYVKHASPIDVVTKKVLAVASIGDRKFTTLTAALNFAVDGDTITLENDVDLTAETISLVISKSLTIDGGDHFILSKKPVTITAKNFMFRNVGFEDPTNENNNASCVYVYSPNETVVFDGCSFEDNQWDAIQCTSKDMKSITIKNCTFALGDSRTYCHRFIHIEPRNTDSSYMQKDAELIITGNTFFADNDTCNDSLITVYGPLFENMTIKDNLVFGDITLTDSYASGNIWISDGLSRDMWDADEGFAVPMIVTSLAVLNTALNSGVSYIMLGDDIDTNDGDDTEPIVVLCNTTIDLNGHRIDGEIWSGWYYGTSPNTRLTLKDTGDGGSVISNFRETEAGQFIQSSAIQSWQHAVTIEGGTYVSNNAAVICQVENTEMVDGVIINGGTFKGVENTGECLEAVIGTVKINGGTFEAADYGSVFVIASGDSDCDTVIEINDGSFSGYCLFDFYKDSTANCIVNVYGGDFTAKRADGNAIGQTNLAFDNHTNAALANNDMFELNIMGGNFNIDPSNYVNTDNYKVTNNGSTWTVVPKN